MREGEGDDLAGEGRVGQAFLIAGHRGVEADLADGIALGAQSVAPEHAAIGQNHDPGISGTRRCGISLCLGHLRLLHTRGRGRNPAEIWHSGRRKPPEGDAVNPAPAVRDRLYDDCDSAFTPWRPGRDDTKSRHKVKSGNFAKCCLLSYTYTLCAIPLPGVCCAPSKKPDSVYRWGIIDAARDAEPGPTARK